MTTVGVDGNKQTLGLCRELKITHRQDGSFNNNDDRLALFWMCSTSKKLKLKWTKKKAPVVN